MRARQQFTAVGVMTSKGGARTIRLRFTFEVKPRVGQFLKSPRGRVAYEVVGIRWNSRDWRYVAEGDTVAPASGVWRGTFVVCRWEPTEIPPGATVHEWIWDKR